MPTSGEARPRPSADTPGDTPADPLAEAAEVAGDRWVLMIVGALAGGPQRFGDLGAEIAGLAPNILIDRLRRMERHGLITAALYSQRPRRFVYDLTEAGRELAAVLPAFAAWAGRRAGGRTPRHDTCGTTLEIRLWCPVCATTVDDPVHADTHRPPAEEDVHWL